MYGSLSASSSSSNLLRSEKLLPPGAVDFDQPRRAFSLPIIKIPFSSSSSSSSSSYSMPTPILPLSGQFGSPGRSTARRFQYGVKNRASHYALPLTVGGLFTIAFFLYVSMRGSTEVGRFNFEGRLHVYSRGSTFSDEEHQHRAPVHAHAHAPGGEADNGVSLLLADEDELIAEDDLFWDSYKDPEPKTAEEQAAEAELKAHKQDVLEHDRLQSLRAIVWWLAEGGIIPQDWEVPSKQYLRKVGGRGVERMLQDIDSGEEGDEIFDLGWADFAKKRYKIVVFSKTHCPYSKKAKSILGEYRLSPAPFIIELDQRSDMDKLQTLLQRLTGRRTVPNVLLDFASIGGSDDITLLHSEGGLQRQFEEMEVIPGARRRRVKKPVKAGEFAVAAPPHVAVGADVAAPAAAPAPGVETTSGTTSDSSVPADGGEILSTAGSATAPSEEEQEAESDVSAKRAQTEMDNRGNAEPSTERDTKDADSLRRKRSAADDDNERIVRRRTSGQVLI